MSGGLSYNQILSYAAGELAGAEATRVEQQLARAPELGTIVGRLRNVFETMRTDDTESASAEALRRALLAWSRLGANASINWLARAQRYIAELVFDSRAQVALAGYRGAGGTRQLAYDSPCGRVDVQIRPFDSRWRVRGQVTLKEPAELGSVALVPREGPAATSTPDRFGGFKIDSAQGIYDLLVELDHGRRAIVAPELVIGLESS